MLGFLVPFSSSHTQLRSISFYRYTNERTRSFSRSTDQPKESTFSRRNHACQFRRTKLVSSFFGNRRSFLSTTSSIQAPHRRLSGQLISCSGSSLESGDVQGEDTQELVLSEKYSDLDGDDGDLEGLAGGYDSDIEDIVDETAEILGEEESESLTDDLIEEEELAFAEETNDIVVAEEEAEEKEEEEELSLSYEPDIFAKDDDVEEDDDDEEDEELPDEEDESDIFAMEEVPSVVKRALQYLDLADRAAQQTTFSEGQQGDLKDVNVVIQEEYYDPGSDYTVIQEEVQQPDFDEKGLRCDIRPGGQTLSAKQVSLLEMAFGQTKHPADSDVTLLSLETRITGPQVVEWFKKKRLMNELGFSLYHDNMLNAKFAEDPRPPLEALEMLAFNGRMDYNKVVAWFRRMRTLTSGPAGSMEKLSANQTRALEQFFSKSQSPTNEELQLIRVRVNTTPLAVTSWLKLRRKLASLPSGLAVPPGDLPDSATDLNRLLQQKLEKVNQNSDEDQVHPLETFRPRKRGLRMFDSDDIEAVKDVSDSPRRGEKPRSSSSNFDSRRRTEQPSRDEWQKRDYSGRTTSSTSSAGSGRSRRDGDTEGSGRTFSDRRSGGNPRVFELGRSRRDQSQDGLWSDSSLSGRDRREPKFGDRERRRFDRGGDVTTEQDGRQERRPRFGDRERNDEERGDIRRPRFGGSDRERDGFRVGGFGRGGDRDDNNEEESGRGERRPRFGDRGHDRGSGSRDERRPRFGERDGGNRFEERRPRFNEREGGRPLRRNNQEEGFSNDRTNTLVLGGRPARPDVYERDDRDPSRDRSPSRRTGSGDDRSRDGSFARNRDFDNGDGSDRSLSRIRRAPSSSDRRRSFDDRSSNRRDSRDSDFSSGRFNRSESRDGTREFRGGGGRRNDGDEPRRRSSYDRGSSDSSSSRGSGPRRSSSSSGGSWNRPSYTSSSQ